MSEHDPPPVPANRHEKPFLFPWNRRLRHLHGVSLRNLNLTTAATGGRHRGKTITDDDAPYNFDTPTKRALRTEARNLTHSASFSNLASANTNEPIPLQKAPTAYNHDGKTPMSKRPGKLRRRSTLHWSSATPRARQDKLQDLTAHRLIDSWFSIHMEGIQEPIYISEVMDRSMNPSFAFFDLDTLGPAVARSDECMLRVWAKGVEAREYIVLVQLKVNLRSLQFVGKSLDSFHHPLPENCVLFHLSDGIYTSFTDLPGSMSAQDSLRDAKLGASEPSSSFDALMQLANLDECIQDALKVRQRLEGEVDDVLRSNDAVRERREAFQAQKEQLTSCESAISGMRKQNTATQRRIDELRYRLQVRREAIVTDTDTPESAQKAVDEQQQEIEVVKVSRQQVVEDSNGQLRRIGEALLTVFPIEAVRNTALQFTIRDIFLPNSTFDDTNRDEIAAALGFTAQLVEQLSIYLVCPLPYPLEAAASFSWIRDPISAGLAQRRYPLHPTSVAYKFEYGVYLLNKDIEFLMSKVGLRVLDIRHTLPNLKYLLYVLTAGSGELPARKSGGIRGLFGGRMTPSMSRRTSEDSVRGGKELLKQVQANGSIIGKEKMDESFSPSSPPTRMVYRPSNLREGG